MCCVCEWFGRVRHGPRFMAGLAGDAMLDKVGVI